MAENKFEWTDELVKEFVERRWVLRDQSFTQAFDIFKKSKEKDIPKDDYPIGTKVKDTWYDGVEYIKQRDGYYSRGSINNFTIHFWEIGYGCRFEIIEQPKPKVPLFTTEDGVLVYDQDEYYYMRNWNYGKCSAFPNCLYGDKEGAMYFSSAEKAQEYILLNRPVQVSYNELQEFFMNNYNVHTLDSTSLKEFFKNKINP